MKVLFINEYLPQEMLGVMWLSRAIKDAGHETKGLFLPDKEWIEKVKEYNPDVVAYSTTTGMQQYFVDLNRKVKDVLPDVFSIMGGPHPTYVPEILEETPGLDAICRGEGEEAFGELLNLLAAGEDYTKVENFWFRDRETGEILVNGQRPPAADIDALGIPDRSVIYDAGSVYRDSDRKVFVTQRGCPMNCSFCFHHALKKKVYSSTNANMTKERHVVQLKKAGCVYARIAFEAASDYIRNAIFRKNTTLKQLEDSAGWIKKHGIRLGSLNMLGGPGASMEDEFDTVRLNIRCKVDHPLVSIMQPYPMFDIEDMTKEMGYAVAAYDDFPVKFNRTSSIEYDNKHEIENLHKLFPILVRYPWLMPLAKPAIKVHFLAPLYLVMYMLYSEWMVSEQAKLYAHAQGLSGPRYWTIIDFIRRVTTKGLLRVYEVVFGRVARRMALRLQMGDERVMAHMD